MQCNSCEQWIHLRCSGLGSTSEYTRAYVGPCCTRGPSPPPSTPPRPASSQTTEPSTFKILQLNICGLRSKLDSVLDYLERNTISVAAIQETMLGHNTTSLKTPGYDVIRADRPPGRGKGGGLAFIVKNTIHHQVINLPLPPPGDKHLEQQAIMLRGTEHNITLINVYIPPESSCSNGYRPSIEHLLNLSPEDSIIVGDFNAHHDLWHSAGTHGSRGTTLASEIEESRLAVLNDHSSTRVTASASSSPDITLMSEAYLPLAEWTVQAALGSDHLPITITLQGEVRTTPRSARHFINFRRADWDGFEEESERLFASMSRPTDPYDGERRLRRALLTAAKRHIPGGSFHETRPFWPREAAEKAAERDALQASHPGHPRIAELGQEIDQATRSHRRDKWMALLDKINLRRGATDLWKTIKKLTGREPPPKCQPLTFGDKTVWEAEEAAEHFNRQFNPRPEQYSRQTRRTVRKFEFRGSRGDDHQFSEEQVAEATKATRSSMALGPDQLAPVYLKHLGPLGIRFLTETINLSLSTYKIPERWKVGRVMPLLKPNKPADVAKSYRPIALLSPVAKIIERLLLPTLVEHSHLAEHQHGFRKGRSTTTALNLITHKIAMGFNRPKPPDRTVLVALDLTAAFDTVDHTVLLEDLYATEIPPAVKKWLCAYLRGRSTVVEYKGKRSKKRKMRQGVPQGGVLSPALFNLYMSKLPSPPPTVSLVSYADDITLTSSAVEPGTACNNINQYLTELHAWLTERNLRLSEPKSSATLFTNWSVERGSQLNIEVAGTELPTTREVKVLGVTLDQTLTFATHARNIGSRLGEKNTILKCLAGTEWGCSKEVLLTTYKTIGRSLINYAAPVWSPALKDTNWQKHLQTKQNAALRIVTGCHRMTSEAHLHRETKVMQVKRHNEMLSLQFLAGARLPERGLEATLQSPPPRSRNVAETLVSRYSRDLARVVGQHHQDRRDHRKVLHLIHRDAAAESQAALDPPRAWEESYPFLPVPDIDPRETELPRSARCTLAQLRSGYSTKLRSYMSRIRRADSPSCPECNAADHTTAHLFQCPNKPPPPGLSVRSLWTDAGGAARFLGLLD